ncbi:hypothetical protein C8R45DRAFT_417245 [Mycena sanguinolenta]|nr:hypothetical protein C8R45DRAFT_417245 [Mycena sanguinolenta]
MARFSRLLPQSKRSLSTRHAIAKDSQPEMALIDSSSSPIVSPSILASGAPGKIAEHHDANMHPSTPHLPMPVDSSVCNPENSIDLDRQTQVDNGGALRRPSESHQTPHRGLTVNGGINTFNAPYVAGDKVINIHYDGQGYNADLEGLRPLIENHPNFLRIICVAIACCLPPSVKWISCVLGFPEAQVRQSIDALAEHLRERIVFDDEIKLPANFVFAMYRSCLQIIGSAHGDIACWCLQEAQPKVEDINYALQYWAWHVSQATPRAAVTRALREFSVVLCSVTEHQLFNVIHWLENCDRPEAAPLVVEYQARLTRLTSERESKPTPNCDPPEAAPLVDAYELEVMEMTRDGRESNPTQNCDPPEAAPLVDGDPVELSSLTEMTPDERESNPSLMEMTRSERESNPTQNYDPPEAAPLDYRPIARERQAPHAAHTGILWFSGKNDVDDFRWQFGPLRRGKEARVVNILMFVVVVAYCSVSFATALSPVRCDQFPPTESFRLRLCARESASKF